MVWALVISTNKVLSFDFRFDFWQLWHCLHLYRHCQNTLTKMEVSMLAHRLETADKVFQNVVPTLATLEPTRFSAQLSISQHRNGVHCAKRATALGLQVPLNPPDSQPI